MPLLSVGLYSSWIIWCSRRLY